MKNKQNKQKQIVSTNAPAAVGTKIKGPKQPNIVNRPDGSCSISHTEFMADVTALATVTTSVTRTNPQNSSMFTWLNAIATRYEMYRFRKLKFHYKPSCSTANQGYYVMGFDFDALDQTNGLSATYPGKAEMLTWKHSTKCAVWEHATLDVSSDSRMQTFRYCDDSSSFDVERGGDARLDVLGNFVQLYKGGSTLLIGEVFVEYTIEFRIPSYKIASALYKTILSGPMPSSNQFWQTTSEVTGNAHLTRIAANQFTINDVGEFLLDVIATNNGGTPLSVALSNPTSAPSSVGSLYNLLQFESVSNGFYSCGILVEVAPMLVTILGAIGVSVAGQIRLATYKNQ